MSLILHQKDTRTEGAGAEEPVCSDLIHWDEPDQGSICALSRLQQIGNETKEVQQVPARGGLTMMKKGTRMKRMIWIKCKVRVNRRDKECKSSYKYLISTCEESSGLRVKK